MIGRADIEGSKSDVATNAWPPQASYPFGNFSVTSGFELSGTRCQVSKGSIGHAFTSRILTENRIINQAFGLLLLRVISGHAEPDFRTPVLQYNRCAAPAKRPVCSCLHRYECLRESKGAPRGGPKPAPRNPGPSAQFFESLEQGGCHATQTHNRTAPPGGEAESGLGVPQGSP